MSGWVAFDFDGTLTRRDSLLPFLHRMLGPARLTAVLALESPWLAAHGARLVSNEAAKVHLLRRALAGHRRDQLEAFGEVFAQRHVAALLRADAMQCLRRHQAAGQRCVLVTASLTLYTRPWALDQGFDAVIGSELAFDADGRTRGELVGGNCYGAEKARRLREQLGVQALDAAYGDSRGDREMMAMAAARHWRGRAHDGGGHR